MKKRKYTLIVFVAFLILFGFGCLQIVKHRANNEVMSYLVDQKGYSKEEISKIYTQVGKTPIVSTTVIFSDELDARYFYRKENGQIYQYSFAPVHGAWDGQSIFKHKERDG